MHDAASPLQPLQPLTLPAQALPSLAAGHAGMGAMADHVSRGQGGGGLSGHALGASGTGVGVGSGVGGAGGGGKGGAPDARRAPCGSPSNAPQPQHLPPAAGSRGSAAGLAGAHASSALAVPGSPQVCVCAVYLRW
jgi:hypothetical protein